MQNTLFQDDYVNLHTLGSPSYYLKIIKDLHLYFFFVLYSVHLYTFELFFFKVEKIKFKFSIYNSLILFLY